MVTVEEMPFSDSPKEAQGIMETLSRHTGVLGDAVSVLVALVLFGAFVRMLRRTKPDDIPMEMLYAPSEGGTLGSGEEGSGSGTGSDQIQPVTVDLINDMIRRKPENVGAALRNWMGKADPEATSEPGQN